MARKNADLRSALQSSAKTAPRTGQSAAVEEPDNSKRADPENPHYRPGRAVKTNITGYFDKPVKIQLKTIGLETGDRTIQELLAEAINDLFAKYKKPEIAKAEE
jgi:hypothetical protein